MPPNAIDIGFAAKLPPEKAIEFFAAKGYAISWNWWEVWESAHARAFTVAKAVQSDVLESIRGALDKALADGQTRREFARQLEPTLQKLGWWGRKVVVDPDGGAEVVQLGSPHRLRTIFDSNMRSTFGAARQRQQTENAGSRPFWMYDARNDGRVRPSHAAMDGQVFRSDDPIWRTHYPPNGWNCRCRVRALTAAQVRARGQRVSDSAGALETVQQEVGVDKRTGEVITKPGTAYRFRAGGEAHVLTPDPGWGAAPRGLPPQAAPVPAPPVFDPGAASASAAREHVVAAASGAATRQVADIDAEIQRLNARINDPTTPVYSKDLKVRAALNERRDVALKEIAVAGRRAILRPLTAPFAGGASPTWGNFAEDNSALRQRVAGALDEWQRLVSPDLLDVQQAPHFSDAGVPRASAAYWWREVRLSASASYGKAIVHELSHLLEDNERVLRRAVDFLSRRTTGDAVQSINEHGELGRPDQFLDPVDGHDDGYVGRVYPYTPQMGSLGVHSASLRGASGAPPAQTPGEAGDRGDVDVYATEVISMGVQWMWQNPAAFAARDPEYFDFIWDTVVRGR